MKKLIIIAVIFIVIALMHVLVAKLIFSDKKSDKAEAGQPNAAAQDTPATDEPVPNIPSKVNPAGTKNLTPEKVSTPPQVKKTSTLLGFPFNYTSAVQGNIPALPTSKDATSGILVNVDTRKVLWSKNPRQGSPIASMTKMMTLLLAMEDISSGRVSLKSPVKVTKAAYLIGGSQVYLDPRETFTLGELMESMAIKSANDSAFLVAEYLGKNDIAGFVARMNSRAAQLKMPTTHFINPHGLPDKKNNSISSPEGMALLAEQLIEYPLILEWTSTKMAYFRPKGTKDCQHMTNTNKLIGLCPGVDGLKTGYTAASGFCVTATCLRGGKRMIAVVTGFKTSKLRNAFVNKLFDWGYKQDASMKVAK